MYCKVEQTKLIVIRKLKADKRFHFPNIITTLPLFVLSPHFRLSIYCAFLLLWVSNEADYCQDFQIPTHNQVSPHGNKKYSYMNIYNIIILIYNAM